MDNKYKHPMRVVSLRTGLSPHVIRAWERRYGAINPKRSETNRRLYSDEEILRLQLLRKATLAGHSISRIAGLSDKELEALVTEDEANIPADGRAPMSSTPSSSAAELLYSCIEAVREMNPKVLEELLARASVRFSQAALISEIVLPLMNHIGKKWEEGEFKIVHEHLASVIVRSFLGNMTASYRGNPSAPSIVVSTPVGQVHEFGALAAAATANSLGWRPIFLGPDLPAEEIAAAAESHGSSVIALSIVHPADDPRVVGELQKLRRLVGGDVSILIGGRAAAGYMHAVEAIGGVFISDLQQLKITLEKLRGIGTVS
jgi:DNA-binding transcriptional MerR regulator/methylmalonyl-CoA mutase cobalamin-binding subunit